MSPSPPARNRKRVLVLAAVVAVLGLLAWYGWKQWRDAGPGEGFIQGNGRIEATEIDMAAKLGGRIEDILVREGDFVQAGQVLARMRSDTLQAQQREAEAIREEAKQGLAAAWALIAQRQSDVAAQQALVAQREAELEAARQRLARSSKLSKEGATSRQELDDDRARARSVEAALVAARAQVVALEAAVEAARAQHTGAQARIRAAEASVARIAAEIDDGELRAPRDGRVQFRLAQPGEVLPAGGRVLNLVDLTDVYMTFFLPETVAGRVAMGSEVRIVLDVAPKYAVPARISFVSSTAQFTPKTVETASERQKLMFRVRAQIPQALLRSRLEQVKTGLPGVAWVRLDPQAPWPEALANVLSAE